MDVIEALMTRTSVPQLLEPAPPEETLTRILAAAVRAPDHSRLKPWSFILVRGEARRALGNLFAEGLKMREPDAPEAVLQREREKPLRAPLIVIVAAAPSDSEKVPPVEQVAAVAAATENLLLAAHGLGFGGFWRTGAAAYDPHVKVGLKLDARYHIVGFVYLGTVGRSGVARAPELDGVVQEWKGPSADS